ncbi:MAG: DUF3617 domain-containing protein [Hyphomonadaceae bacterium JAD_PAG50586_4]|nr:MAG: DUF3617 domain-containing protein [Hyphomonadaceae bacterium JAD_PAG50586_4]
MKPNANPGVRITASLQAVAAVAGIMFIAAQGAPALADDPPLHAGAWEITRERSGGPGGDAVNTETVCYLAEALLADPGAPLRMRPPVNRGAETPECAISDFTMNGGAVSYVAACAGPMGTVRGNWSGQYSQTSFDLSGQFRMGFMSMNARLRGRHVGACSG